MKELRKDVNLLKKSNETKYHDESDTGANTYYDIAAVSTLFDPAAGTGPKERIGDTCSPYRIQVNGLLKSTTTTSSSVCRVTLIQSKGRFVPLSQSSTSVPQKVWTKAGQANAPFSHYFTENRGHFTVLYDKVFVISGSTVDGGNVKFNINKKLSKKVRYTQGTNVAESGQLYLMFTSDEANAGGIGPTRLWESRVLFKD